MPHRPLSLEEKVRILWAEKEERDRGNDENGAAYSAMLESAVAQLEPRFQAFEKVNATQLSLLRAAEGERVRRAARDEVLREQKERDDVVRAVKAADRRHALKVWGAVAAILAILVPLAAAAIGSQMHTPAPAVDPHREGHP